MRKFDKVKAAASIRAAAKRIAVPGGYTKYALARNKRGTAADLWGSDAVSWCMLGAMYKEDVAKYTPYDAFVAYVFGQMYKKQVTDFNDQSGTSQWDAVAALNRFAEDIEAYDADNNQ